MYRRIKDNYANVAATLALVLALGTSGAYAANLIKPNSITSKDIKANAVKSSDIKNGSVQGTDVGAGQINSADIGNGDVTPEDVTLPAPVASTQAAVSAPVSNAYGLIDTVMNYNKTTPDSVLEVEWNGIASPGPQTDCLYQLRVNGQPAPAGGGVVYAHNTAPVTASTSALWPGLPAGPVVIELWAKWTANDTASPSCGIDPANLGVTSTFTAVENVT